MLLIPCPWCGPRDQCEFTYGGAAVKFPPLDQTPPAARNEWHNAVHVRDNPRGLTRELWYHEAGCECWIEVMRDTLTHEISAADAD